MMVSVEDQAISVSVDAEVDARKKEAVLRRANMTLRLQFFRRFV